MAIYIHKKSIRLSTTFHTAKFCEISRISRQVKLTIVSFAFPKLRPRARDSSHTHQVKRNVISRLFVDFPLALCYDWKHSFWPIGHVFKSLIWYKFGNFWYDSFVYLPYSSCP